MDIDQIESEVSDSGEQMQRDLYAQREEEAFEESNAEQDTLTEQSSEDTSEEVTSNNLENSDEPTS
jgi:hypothetical protein